MSGYVVKVRFQGVLYSSSFEYEGVEQNLRSAAYQHAVNEIRRATGICISVDDTSMSNEVFQNLIVKQS